MQPETENVLCAGVRPLPGRDDAGCACFRAGAASTFGLIFSAVHHNLYLTRPAWVTRSCGQSPLVTRAMRELPVAADKQVSRNRIRLNGRLVRSS